MENKVVMEKELYKAAVAGNTGFLNDDTKLGDYFLRKTFQNNNIIHISAQQEQFYFTEEAVQRFPQLICEPNCDGNNPLHIAAETGNLGIVELLVKAYKEFAQKQGEDERKALRMVNIKGNTPLHVALIYGRIKMSCFLVEEDPSLACVSNIFLETPLHLAVQHRVQDDRKLVGAVMKLVGNKHITSFQYSGSCIEKNSLCIIELLLQKEPSVACYRDTKGLTPLLRAAMLNPPFLMAIEVIVKCCPESVEACDSHGKTILHLMNKLPNYIDLKKLLSEYPELLALKNKQDNAGNTAAHTAVYNDNSNMLLVLSRSSANLAIKNNLGVSAADLIQQQSDDFQSFLKAQAKKIPEDYQFDTELLNIDMNNATEFELSHLRGKHLIDNYNVTHGPCVGNFLHKYIWENRKAKTNVQIIEQALEIWPSLICQIDSMGSTPLHYIACWKPELVDLQFKEKLVQCFRKVEEEGSVEELCYDPPWKSKNRDGNTPVHLALQTYNNVHCAKVILELDPELANEVNNCGETPLHLLSDSCDPKGEKDIEYIMKASGDNVHKADGNGLSPIMRAVEKKNLYFILLLFRTFTREVHDGYDSFKWASSTLDDNGNSFWHLLAESETPDFWRNEERVSEMLNVGDLYPAAQFIMVGNKDGNSPLHIAVQKRKFHLAIFLEKVVYAADHNFDTLGNYPNNDGNTPLLLATGKSNEFEAESFYGKMISPYRNDFVCDREGNNTLHLAVLNNDHPYVRIFFEKANSTCIKNTLMKCNKEGDTPLHLVIEKGDLEGSNNLFFDYAVSVPEIQLIGNKDGNTPLHLAIMKGDLVQANMLFDEKLTTEHTIKLLESCNKDGNTPLHLALERDKTFTLAMTFIEKAATAGNIDTILQMRNKKDDSPGDFIGAKHLQYEFEEFLWSNPRVVEAMLGVRSLIGVPTAMIKEYTNTIGVTAALFATITFTAAFTVPGGLNSTNGTPLLLSKAAFQVFMVSDILAMCLSMMVLFCLLWIMTLGNKKHQVVLLDLTIFLLEGSFYATLLTFLLGLYVTVFPVARWIAVLACVLCSLLILLMHKRFIVGLIPCFILIFVRFRKAYFHVKCFMSRLMRCRSNQNSVDP